MFECSFQQFYSWMALIKVNYENYYLLHSIMFHSLTVLFAMNSVSKRLQLHHHTWDFIHVDSFPVNQYRAMSVFNSDDYLHTAGSG